MGSLVREEFWEYVCNVRTFLYPFLLFGVTVLLLSFFALPYVEPGSAESVVLRIDIAVTVVTLVLVGTLVVLCSRRVEPVE